MSGSSQNATSFLSQARKTMQVSADHVRLSGLKRLRDVEEMDKFDGLEIKKAIRREQCRHNQARYRDRQRAFQRRAQHETNRSAWSIVTDLFRLLETGFRSPWHMTNADEMMKHTETREILAGLQKAFEHDVGKGDLHGVEALAEQLRRYSLYFIEPQMHLQRAEETGSWRCDGYRPAKTDSVGIHTALCVSASGEAEDWG
ncbi:hypothetical protein JG687_00017481 [Phytophthora cactorum]|nr:hypothetical protein JG687_00017481 [Phytophthora cactorum]